MKSITLANGFTVQALSQPDATVIYHELWQMQSYNKHGIEVKDNDTIIDVGANIGLFSIYLAQQHQGLQLYAFEPVRAIYECLLRNSDQHLKDCKVHLFNSGISNKPGEEVFSFCPALSMAAGMYSSELSKHQPGNATVFDWLIAMLQDMKRANIIAPVISRFLVKALQLPVIRLLLLILLSLPLLGLLIYLRITTKKVNCTLTTLSSVFKEKNIVKADLVKIDVEGAELDVLNGIAPNDFSKIKQFVIEVHDIDNRVQQITQMLQQYNYTVVTDREDWRLHQLMNIYTIFAIRGL